MYRGIDWVVLGQFPLEDVLPWDEFALRLPKYTLYRLPEAVEVIVNNPDKVVP